MLNDNITYFNKILYRLQNFTSTLFDLNKLLKKNKYKIVRYLRLKIRKNLRKN